MASSGGRAWWRLAASSTFGSSVTSPTVFRKTPGRPSTQCTARSMSSCSCSGSYQVRGGLLAAVPRRERDRLDRLQGDAALGAHGGELPRSRRRSARPASGRSCRGASTESNGKRSRLRTVHPRHRQAVAGDADEADEALVARLDGRLERAAFAQRGLPLDHVDEVVQLDQVDVVDAEAVERAADLLARAVAVALAGLRREEELGRGAARATARGAAPSRRTTRRCRCG